MEFNYAYKGNTSIDNFQADKTNMSFVPDATRIPTYFSGELGQNVAFREAISALHDVVVSDMRFKPKDKSDYKEWALRQERVDLVKVSSQKQEIKEEMVAVSKEIENIYKQRAARLAPFYNSRQKYFNYLYEKNKDFWFVLDPVITVHPDEIFFECFSQDESSYGKLGINYEGFKNIGEFSCGTTNIDYSENLYQEFQKIRSYKKTFFQVDSSGFEVKTTNQDEFKEVKIDLPDSWVRGFLQVNSAMTIPAVKIDLHPMDIYNICHILRRHKEKLGPRSMKYVLKPNEPVKIIFEPWGTELICPRSFYYGSEKREIKVWGRRRLLILERLIQLAQKFTVHLLGQGMPSFYIADLGHMNFTLGLSGWTANDWSTSGNFDLMAPREDVDYFTQKTVFNALKENWFESPDSLSERLHLDKSTVLGALSAYTQAGKAIFDLNKNVYRIRELSRETLDMTKLRFSSPREESANFFVKNNQVKIDEVNDFTNSGVKLRGNVTDKNHVYYPNLIIDADQRLSVATCTCNWYTQNKLYKGPCEHMLALRIQYGKNKGLSERRIS